MSDAPPRKSKAGPLRFAPGRLYAAAAWELVLRQPKTCPSRGSDGKVSWFDFVRRRLAD